MLLFFLFNVRHLGPYAEGLFVLSICLLFELMGNAECLGIKYTGNVFHKRSSQQYVLPRLTHRTARMRVVYVDRFVTAFLFAFCYLLFLAAGLHEVRGFAVHV